ncbi:MAG: hypothetical protein GXY15_13975 [Candidatus Hydrogenedentes bacterium]|nr:hypothetical protein [Candidatus Hydrogenedentota bacterium]
MEDNKFLFFFGAVLVVFLGLPVVLQAARGGPAKAGAPGTPAGAAEAPAQPPKEPPLLNEGNLIGTEWEADVQGFPVTVSLAAGGVVYASHPMAKQVYGVDYLEGRWQVNYEKVKMFMSFGGKDYEFDFEIIGSKLFYHNPELKGKLGEVKRLR